MDKGWVCMWRKLNDNPVSKKPLVCHLFLYIVRTVNYKDNKIIWNSKEMIVERGSMITGRKALSQATGLSEQNIRTGLEILYNLGMLQKSTSKSTSKFSYITVCNFKDYQDYEKQSNQQINQEVTSNQPASNQQVTTNNNVNNNNNENKEDKKNSSNQKADLEHFDFLWKQYPNKTGLKRSRSYYKNSVMSGLKRKEIEQALENYKSHLALPGNKFLKPQNGSTWFNNWGDWVGWLAPIAENPQQSAQRPLTNLEEIKLYQRNRDKKKRQEEPLNG